MARPVDGAPFPGDAVAKTAVVLAGSPYRQQDGLKMWQLRVGIYDFRFRAIEEIRLPPLQGNMWRGVFGRQLRFMSDGRLAPPPALPDWIRQEDLYAYFMTTPPPPDAPAMRRYPQVPHPFALSAEWADAERTLAPGEEFGMRLRLFGRANELIDVAMLAFARAAHEGLGKGRGRARLEEVAMCKPALGEGARLVVFRPGSPPLRHAPVVPRMPESGVRHLRLQFLSPMRLQYQGRIMTPAGFAMPALLMNVLRRISMLQLFHEGVELDVDFRAFKEQAARMRILRADLHWADAHRYSSSQKQQVPAGGVMGEVEVDLTEAPEALAPLWLGQHLQAGKGTTLGLGMYRLAMNR